MEKEDKAFAPSGPARSAAASHPDFLTPKEYAASVGVEVHAVYRWIREGRIRAYRPGRSALGRWAIPLKELRQDMIPERFLL